MSIQPGRAAGFKTELYHCFLSVGFLLNGSAFLTQEEIRTPERLPGWSQNSACDIICTGEEH